MKALLNKALLNNAQDMKKSDKKIKPFSTIFWSLLICSLPFSSAVHADIVTDWNITARNIVVDSKLVTPYANRAVAVVHTSIYASINSITQEFPQYHTTSASAGGESIEAAVASASYTSLMSLVPQQRIAIGKAYSFALDMVADGSAKEAGIALGRRAAESILAARGNDGASAIEQYRPSAKAGDYVPTVIPAVPHWPNRTPWLLNSPSQFRASAPPALNSKLWAKDLNEVKQLGSLNSTVRTQEQTNMAKFWEATLPPIYHGVVHSIAAQGGRSATQNARLFALVTQATDDALIAVFDGKYHYGLWRPITAIRNADNDGNPDTLRDATWRPFIRTPMHPEYPCAHCVVASTVGSILKAEMKGKAMPLLSTVSETANGVSRQWASVDEFVQEVSNARIYDGVHYRTSTEAGNEMGIKIAAHAISEF
jgi:hypothetical protein